MKSQEALLKIVEAMPRMARGRLCVLSRSAKGGKFYHLQYRKDTKLFQKYIPLREVAAYEEATEQYRRFMEAVDAFVNDMSRQSMREIAEECGKEVRKRSSPEKGGGRKAK